MKYTVTQFRKNIREILDTVDRGAEVIIVRYDKQYLLLNGADNAPVYGVDPSFARVAQEPETAAMRKVRGKMSKAMNKGRDKQAELMTKNIVSDLDMSLADNKFRVTVTPNKEKTAEHVEHKFGKAPKGIAPVDSCPHGYAKGFCKKVDCNRKYQK